MKNEKVSESIQGNVDHIYHIFPYCNSILRLPRLSRGDLSRSSRSSRVVPDGGTPSSLDGFHNYHGKSQSKIQMIWGYPYFRKPPYQNVGKMQSKVVSSVINVYQLSVAFWLFHVISIKLVKGTPMEVQRLSGSRSRGPLVHTEIALLTGFICFYPDHQSILFLYV